jgi:hypothetical protein
VLQSGAERAEGSYGCRQENGDDRPGLKSPANMPGSAGHLHRNRQGDGNQQVWPDVPESVQDKVANLKDLVDHGCFLLHEIVFLR